METNGKSFLNALNSFIKTSNSYLTTKSDTNLITLHRQLDENEKKRNLNVFLETRRVIQSLKILNELSASNSEIDVYDSRNVAMTESVSSLVTLLNDENVTNGTIQKILELFQKWISNPTLHDVLKTTFQLELTITSFVLIHADDEEAENIVSQCLDILKTLTYDIKINYADVNFEDFLKFLVRNVQSEAAANRTNCVVILANICRKNAVVQSRIRNMEGVRYFYRTIVNMISLPSEDLLQVAALSVFASVASNEEIGTKLFHSKNVIRTLELIIHKIMNKDVDVQCFAIDILIDLLAVEKIQRLLLQYEYLDHCLMKILCSLDKRSCAKSVCKIYELLLTLPSLTGLQGNVDTAFRDVEANPACDHPISVALHWLSHPADKLWNPSVWAAKFVTQILKNSSTSVVDNHFDSILTAIVSCLESLLEARDSSLAAHCETFVSNMDLLLTLCQNKNYLMKVDRAINVEFCTEAIDFLMGHFQFELEMGHRSMSINNNGYVVDAILHTLLVMKTTKNSTNGMQNSLYQYIQDPRMMPIFAFALTSVESQDLLNNALQLVFLGSRLPDFPTMRLSETMTDVNKFRGQFVDVANTSDPNGIDRSKFGPMCSTIIDMDPITEIIDRFQSGLEVKDVKKSVIMEMYEHKILSLEMKEKQLQGLLDAKANALQHADRILVEYRSRWARSDAEALQLRHLLRESEKLSEAAKEEATKALSHRQQLEHNLQQFCEMTNELEQKNEEHKRNEIENSNKIQSLQNIQKDILREKKILSDANIALQQSRDELETKAFELSEKVSQLDAQNVNVLKQLKERDVKVKDLLKAGRQLETEKENLMEIIRKYKDEIKSLETEVNLLKGKCNEQEILLDAARNEIHTCKAELDKHRQITEMIHSMSALKDLQQQKK